MSTPHPAENSAPDERLATDPLVTFVETPELKPVTSAALAIKEAEDAAAAPATVRVRVVKPYRVVHAGKAYTEGDVVAVPEHLAAEWEAAQSVKRVRVHTKKEK